MTLFKTKKNSIKKGLRLGCLFFLPLGISFDFFCFVGSFLFTIGFATGFRFCGLEEFAFDVVLFGRTSCESFREYEDGCDNVCRDNCEGLACSGEFTVELTGEEDAVLSVFLERILN